jgi:YD repeat-containing protein
VTDPLDRVRELGYDLDGNLIRETNARGQTTRYETDPLGRVTAVGYSDHATETWSSQQLYVQAVGVPLEATLVSSCRVVSPSCGFNFKGVSNPSY